MTRAALSKETMDTAVGFLMDARAAPGDAALRGRIEAWLDEADDNRRAWLRAQRAWAMLGEVEAGEAELGEAESGVPAPSPAQVIAFPAPRERPGRRRVWVTLGALAASVALALAASPSLLLRMRADYATGTGEIRDVRLADGSVVRLGARSAIDADLSGGVRRVRLLAGEAWFDVARDPAHPFVVDADDVETRVLGTAFEVRAKALATEVGVARGHVRVTAAAGRRDLLPGDRVTVDRADGRMRAQKVPVGSLASWRDGHVFADDATVGEIVEELRRYDKGWIVLADGALASRRITGLYDARDPGRALEAVVAPAGGTITHVTPYLTIIRAR
ncbi:FecR family protein [Novosphingobium resinovorum]|uniref:FecR family protein n=1 Tax=Novosphingobium resinovorum TaxID=158500 RepID=UPI002ED30C23|nr:FecR domain-containing protein [Novosphingobium resinovorum]